MSHRLISDGPPAALFASDVASWRRTATLLGTVGAGGLLVCAALPGSSAHDTGVFLVAAPLLVVFVVAGKQLVSGVMAGAVKG